MCTHGTRNRRTPPFFLMTELGKRYQSHFPNFANVPVCACRGLAARAVHAPARPGRREAPAHSPRPRGTMRAGTLCARSAPARRHVRRLHVCGCEVHVRLRENMLEPQDGGKVGVGAHGAGRREGARAESSHGAAGRTIKSGGGRSGGGRPGSGAGLAGRQLGRGGARPPARPQARRSARRPP